MYLLTESLRSALISIRANKLRSFLTTLGIVIGVAAVVAVVALIQGFSQSISNQFRGMGSDNLIIQAYLPIKDQLAGKTARITSKDMLSIQHQIPHLTGISPILGFGGKVQHHDQITNTEIWGTTPALAQWFSAYPDQGRFLVPGDDRYHRRVAVIGTTVLDNLHLQKNPVGEYIRINNNWFRIVGVLHKLGSLLGNDQDNHIVVPFGTARSLMGSSLVPNITIELKVAKGADINAVAGRIRTLLRRNHHLKPGQANDFKVQTASQFSDSWRKILGTITLVAGGIVGIALLVGGIGIMNIMLVSVTERTKEIGILKSLGARRSDILLQFLIESATLALLGGLIGLMLGYGIGLLVLHLVPGFGGASIPIWAALLAIGFSGGTGIIFGIAPAARAAALDPIEALNAGSS